MTAREEVASARGDAHDLDLRGGVEVRHQPDAGEIATAVGNALDRLDRCLARWHDPGSARVPLILEIDPEVPDQHYELTADAAEVVVAASGPDGLRHAIHALARLVIAGRGRVAPGVICDGPRVAVRGLGLDAGRRYWQLDTLYAVLNEMAWLGLNRLHLHLTEWNAFRIGLNDPRFAGLAAPDHYSADDLNALIAAAHRDGIEVAVELNLPAHCSALIAAVPDLDVGDADAVLRDGSVWTGCPTRTWMVDVTSPAVVAYCERLVAALVREVRADSFHLGGDEWFSAGQLERSPSLVTAAADLTARRVASGEAGPACTPADVVVDFLNRMCGVVRRLGGRAELWSWWQEAGAAALRPDPDITITAWGTAVEAQRLAAEGHPVIACPEATHYVTPRTAPGNLDGVNYVVADPALLRTLPMMAVDGEQLAVWCDWAEEQPDDYFLWYATRSMHAFAARTWSGPVDSDELRTAAVAVDVRNALGPPFVTRPGPQIRLGSGERIAGVRIDVAAGRPLTSRAGKWTAESAAVLDGWRGAVIELAPTEGTWSRVLRLDRQLPPTWVTVPVPASAAVAARVRRRDGAAMEPGQVEWLIVPDERAGG